MDTGKTLFLAAALAAALQGCGGGGGSDSTQPAPPISPAPPPIVKTGDFELVAGTLDATAPADAPRYGNGPAIGVNLARENSVGNLAVGANGHIYLLKQTIAQNPADQRAAQLDLIEIDPSTGLMRVQQIPYNPNPWPDVSSEPLPAKVIDPASFTVASDGSVLIADNVMIRTTTLLGAPPFSYENAPYGIGIWRFKDGALSRLAGFAGVPLPQTQDGQGGEASFSFIQGSCAGPDGAIFVNDSSGVRKVLPDGTVSTLYANLPSDTGKIVCATNQRAIARISEDGQAAFHELSSGQSFGQGYPVYQGVYVDWTDPQSAAVITTLTYGFGDMLAINQWGGFGTDQFFSIFNLKTWPAPFAPWIRNPDSFSTSAAPPAFQLETMPYAVPSPEIVIDDNDMAYLYSGNALLRYPLKKLQSNQ
jgi:hypothetical protein